MATESYKFCSYEELTMPQDFFFFFGNTFGAVMIAQFKIMNIVFNFYSCSNKSLI